MIFGDKLRVTWIERIFVQKSEIFRIFIDDVMIVLTGDDVAKDAWKRRVLHIPCKHTSHKSKLPKMSVLLNNNYLRIPVIFTRDERCSGERICVDPAFSDNRGRE